MAVDKKIDYVEQDGSLNFIKNSESVTVPKKFKARKEAPTTKLAYITDAEAKMLKKMKKGTPHKGPKGIPSYDSFGSIDASGKDTGRAGSQVSAAERGDFRGFDGSPPVELPPGVTPKGSKAAQDLRSAFIAAGGGQRVNPGFFDSRNRVSPVEIARAKAFAPKAFRAGRNKGLFSFLGSGGFFGNLLRGLGQKLGLGKRFDEPTYDMSEFSAYGLGGSQNPVYYDDFDNTGLLSLVEDINKSKSEDDDYDPIFDNALMAKIATNSPALAQLRSLQKKQVLSNMGGPEFTIEDQQKLDQLEEMEADPVNVYSQTV